MVSGCPSGTGILSTNSFTHTVNPMLKHTLTTRAHTYSHTQTHTHTVTQVLSLSLSISLSLALALSLSRALSLARSLSLARARALSLSLSGTHLSRMSCFFASQQDKERARASERARTRERGERDRVCTRPPALGRKHADTRKTLHTHTYTHTHFHTHSGSKASWSRCSHGLPDVDRMQDY